ncbi:MAG: hypothetical protein R3F25_05405 [Gammaproteobacteria bacterium]
MVNHEQFKAMYLRLVFLTFLFINTSSIAKVAYLPLTDFTPPFEVQNRIAVLDIDSSSIIKNIYLPDEYLTGSVFLNSEQTKLYAGTYNHIIVINTNTLEVEQSISIPSPAETIFLNQTDDTLYFSTSSSQFLYQLNLLSNTVSVAVDFGIYSINKAEFNESLNTAIFILSDGGNSTIFKVFDIKTMSELFSYDAPSYNSDLISNDGSTYFHFVNQDSSIYSRSLVDGSINWVTQISNESFGVIFENFDNTITAISHQKTYKINKSDGQWSIQSNIKLSDFTDIWGVSFERIENNSFFAINHPAFFCLTGWCSPITSLKSYTLNFNDNTVSNNYQNEQIVGSYARGRYIGDLLYSPPIIPIFGNSGLLILVSVLLCTGIFYSRQYNH